MLWFDVERRYNSTSVCNNIRNYKLWFDVERRYNSTVTDKGFESVVLWFDVERRYNSTRGGHKGCTAGCGLM